MACTGTYEHMIFVALINGACRLIAFGKENNPQLKTCLGEPFTRHPAVISLFWLVGAIQSKTTLN